MTPAHPAHGIISVHFHSRQLHAQQPYVRRRIPVIMLLTPAYYMASAMHGILTLPAPASSGLFCGSRYCPSTQTLRPLRSPKLLHLFSDHLAFAQVTLHLDTATQVQLGRGLASFPSMSPEHQLIAVLWQTHQENYWLVEGDGQFWVSTQCNIFQPHSLCPMHYAQRFKSDPTAGVTN